MIPSKTNKKERIVQIYSIIDEVRVRKDERVFKRLVREYTRLVYDRKEFCKCFYCKNNALEFHHKIYRFPPLLEDLVPVCPICNKELGAASIEW